MDLTPPYGLSGAGRRVWSRVFEAGGVPDTQLESVLLACKQADRAAECREILGKSGLLVVDSRGQEKPHPAIEIERKASLACATLLRSALDVSPTKAKELASEDMFS